MNSRREGARDGVRAYVAAADRPGLAILLIILSTMCFVSMDTLVKLLGAGYPTAQLVFFRCATALVLLLPLVAMQPRARLRIHRPGMFMLRCLSGMISIYCFFAAFRYLPLTEVSVIANAAPILITALSVPLLGERVGIRRWSAVLVGFIGVLIVLRPGGALFTPMVLWAVAAMVFYSLSMIAVRQISRDMSAIAQSFHFTLFCAVISGVIAPFDWEPPRGTDWFLLPAIGLIGACAQLLLTKSISLAPPSVVIPFDYTYIPMAAVVGYLVFGDVPYPGTLLGTPVIVASGLYILYRETKARVAR